MDCLPEIRILIIDFLDSYTYNIPAFIRTSSQRSIRCDVIDYRQRRLCHITADLSKYDGIILSPGPGTVDNPDDLGQYVPALLRDTIDFPIFGVCLGFQAICKAFGGSVKRLPEPHHGIVSDLLDPCHNSLGRSATRYHSLEVDLEGIASDSLKTTALAKNMDDTFSVMEFKHQTRPIWGVQYHPESVSSEGCSVVVQPFVEAAYERCLMRMERNNTALLLSEPPCLDQFVTDEQHRQAHSVMWEKIALSVDLIEVIRCRQQCEEEYVLLESAGSKGRWTVLVSSLSSWHFTYRLRDRRCAYAVERGNGLESVEENLSLESMWDTLDSAINRVRYVGGPDEVPFWGGFAGYLSYELGLAQLDLDAVSSLYSNCRPSRTEHNDVHLLYAYETIAYDNDTGTTYLLSLRRDAAWMESTKEMLTHLSQAPNYPLRGPIRVPFVDPPRKEEYLEKVRKAQEHIKAGNSYELCVTADTRCGTREREVDDESSADLFRILRSQNPAEFMSLIRLGGIDFVSASPEEFMSFNSETRIAQISPIKGTVPKRTPDGREVLLEEAVAELKSLKVRAENLMIVDLTRNDLSKVSSNVNCSKLFCVQALETMYQLVSTVSAVVDPEYSALDVLRSSFPPGSMTGAPKRRSCEILQHLESSPRGLYSGLVGFIDVRGNCRTSVSIRNAVRYAGDEGLWHIGAGGAITSMSDPEEEWEERQVKSQSVLEALNPQHQVLETILYTAEEALVMWDEHMYRLFNSLKYFGFVIPHSHREGVYSDASASSSDVESLQEMSRVLRLHIETAMGKSNLEQSYRASLTVDRRGKPSTRLVQIPITSSNTPVRVFLDPHTEGDFRHLEPFIVHKTTNRAHYEAARVRVGAQGRDEVLMFCSSPYDTQSGGQDSILTEGSYTNVAVMDAATGRLVTPSFGCLPGIERARLLSAGDIVEGTIKREQLRHGMKVVLFNSVRGMFDGIIQGQ